MTVPFRETIRNMEDIFCSHPFGRKPYSYLIYTVRTFKTPSQWGIPAIRFWKTQFFRAFRRNLPQREP